jgi:hypothetical protein
VKPLALQAPAPHELPCAQLWHFPAPSQVPSKPQVDMADAGHSVAFLEVPALRGEQTPSVLPVFAKLQP